MPFLRRQITQGTSHPVVYALLFQAKEVDDVHRQPPLQNKKWVYPNFGYTDILSVFLTNRKVWFCQLTKSLTAQPLRAPRALLVPRVRRRFLPASAGLAQEG